MDLRWVDARPLLRGVVVRIRDADVGTLAAAVAYNAFLAIVPLTLALLGVAAFVGQSESALARIERTLAVFAPEAVTEFITDLLVDAESRLGGQQGWVIPVSVLVALFLGSRAVVALQKALAAVENRTERRPALQMRIVAFVLTIAGGAALLITSFLLVFGEALMEFLAELTSIDALETLWAWLRIPVSALGLLAFLLAFYRWGPPEPLPKSWLAALVAGAGAVLASLGFGFYLANSPSLGATFGALGAVAVALVWLYVGAFMILLGAVVVAYVVRNVESDADEDTPDSAAAPRPATIPDLPDE
jgi:membrane protein